MRALIKNKQKFSSYILLKRSALVKPQIWRNLPYSAKLAYKYVLKKGKNKTSRPTRYARVAPRIWKAFSKSIKRKYKLRALFYKTNPQNKQLKKQRGFLIRKFYKANKQYIRSVNTRRKYTAKINVINVSGRLMPVSALTATSRARLRELTRVRYITPTHKKTINIEPEIAVLKVYTSLTAKNSVAKFHKKPLIISYPLIQGLKKRGYLKYIIRLQYKWAYRPELRLFRIFKKFFRRNLKKYRKISKNKLFVLRLRQHFPKLTGYSEKELYKLWASTRKNYSQYWGHTGAVQRFNQALLLSPAPLSVFLKLSPSLAASKYLLKSGAFIINGLASTLSNSLLPGDLLQINIAVWRATKALFNYQIWNRNLQPMQHLSFMQIDYSSMLFVAIRWPNKHEFLAPSFLSERWLRYFIRQFPVRARKFQPANANWRVYKKLPKR